MKPLLRDLFWILPVSLSLGLTLSLLDGGTWWIGLLAYSLLLTLGLLALTALWRSAGAPRTLILLLLLAVFLRLGSGIFFSYVLPVYGYDSEVHAVGSIYRDASTYDRQAWELADSGNPLWTAFDRSSGIEEQYGGLTLTLSFTYRLLSPDFHRRWLTILLVALVNAMGVGFAWRGIKDVFNEKIAWVVTWILVLYPEAVFAGCSQIREPFLLLFIAMFFWGLAHIKLGRRIGWVWLAGGAAGMFLFSPPAAGTVILIGGVWAWLYESGCTVKWGWVIGILVVATLAFMLFGYIAGGALQAPATGPLGNIIRWFQYSARWSLYGTQQSSDGLQPIFDALPNSFHIPLVTLYGVFQPLLPAAIADPAPWAVSIISISRSLGWYLLLPLLDYSPFISKRQPKETRLAWGSLCLVVWAWIMIASFRAGGDQWDNPRYRLILLFFQGLLAGSVWIHWRSSRDVWFTRFLIVEAIFLFVFEFWYVGRYTDWSVPHISLLMVGAVIVCGAFLVFAGGWLLDQRRVRSKRQE